MCFAKAWEACSVLETKVDQLVMLCGEVAHRVNYDKSDVERKHPMLGDLSFTLNVAFLSELAKILPQSDTSFSPSDKIYLAPPAPKPWEM